MPLNKNKNKKPDSVKSTSTVLIKNICSRKVLDMLDQKIVEMEKREIMREKFEKKKETRKTKPLVRPRSAPLRGSAPTHGRKRHPLKSILRKTDSPVNTNNARPVGTDCASFYTYTSPAPSRQYPYQNQMSSCSSNVRIPLKGGLAQSVPDLCDPRGSRSPQVRFEAPSRDMSRDQSRPRRGVREDIDQLISKYSDKVPQKRQSPVTHSHSPSGGSFEQSYRSNVNGNKRQAPNGYGRDATKQPSWRSASSRNESGSSWRDVTSATQDMIARYDAIFERQRLGSVGKKTPFGGSGDSRENVETFKYAGPISEESREMSDVSAKYSRPPMMSFDRPIAPAALSTNNNKYTGAGAPGPLDSGFDYKGNFEKLDRLISRPQTLESLIQKYSTSYTNSYTPWKTDSSLSGGSRPSNFQSTALKREFSSGGYGGMSGYSSATSGVYGKTFSSYSKSSCSQNNCSFMPSNTSISSYNTDYNNVDMFSRRTPYVAASPVPPRSTIGTNNSNAIYSSSSNSRLHTAGDDAMHVKNYVSDSTPSVDQFREVVEPSDPQCDTDEGLFDDQLTPTPSYNRDVRGYTDQPSSGYRREAGQYQSKFMASLMKEVPSSRASLGPRKTYAELMATYKVRPELTSTDDDANTSVAPSGSEYERDTLSSETNGVVSRGETNEERQWSAGSGSLASDTCGTNEEDSSPQSVSVAPSDTKDNYERYQFMSKDGPSAANGCKTFSPSRERSNADLAQDLLDLANGKLGAFTAEEKDYVFQKQDSYLSQDESHSFRPSRKGSSIEMNERNHASIEKKAKGDVATTSRVKHIDSLLSGLSSWKM